MYPNNIKYKVNVVCLTYNQSEFINDTLNGFCSQITNFPFIVSIIDDASTDGEQKTIRDYICKNFDEESIIEQETGYAYLLFAKNKTNANCYFSVLLLKENHFQNPQKYKGKKMQYISEWRKSCAYESICEGDDYWIDPYKLQKQVDYMDEHSSCSLCHTSFMALYEDNNKFLLSRPPKYNDLEVSAEKLIIGYPIQTCTVMYRIKDYLQVIDENDFMFSGYFKMGDIQIWYQLLKKGYIHWISDTTSIYRKNNGSATRMQKPEPYYRFALSTAEVRYYFIKHDGLDGEVLLRITKALRKELLNYLCFNPTFKPELDYSFTFTFFEKLYVYFGFGKILLEFKLYLQHIIGPISRYYRKYY